MNACSSCEMKDFHAWIFHPCFFLRAVPVRNVFMSGAYSWGHVVSCVIYNLNTIAKAFQGCKHLQWRMIAPSSAGNCNLWKWSMSRKRVIFRRFMRDAELWEVVYFVSLGRCACSNQFCVEASFDWCFLLFLHCDIVRWMEYDLLSVLGWNKNPKCLIFLSLH